MVAIRYPQFCALARAAEILGERWTPLIIRELLLGPKRFSNLRARLDGVSASVLTERLFRLEKTGLVRRTLLEPPAASTVYELTADGEALRPAVFELIRWGARFLLPPRRGERLEPDWIRLVLAAYARKGRVPRQSFEVRIQGEGEEVVISVIGGPEGTTVTRGPAPADVTIITDAMTVLGLMAGMIHPEEALKQRRITAQGNLTLLPVFSQLFEVPAGEEVRSQWLSSGLRVNPQHWLRRGRHSPTR